MLFSFALTGSFLFVTAQSPSKKSEGSAATPAEKVENLVSNIKFNPDEKVITQHLTTIKGQKVPYQATTGTLPVWDEDGKQNLFPEKGGVMTATQAAAKPLYEIWMKALKAGR